MISVRIYPMITRSRPKKDTPLSHLTTLRAKEESKLRAREETERISVLGQKDEGKAKEWVMKEFKRVEKEAEMDWEKDMEVLTHLRNTDTTGKKYGRYLAMIISKFTKEEDLPGKYSVETTLDDKGVLVRITGTKYQAGFTPSGIPAYDRHACKIMAVRVGNTVAKLEGFLKVTDGGVILPDEEDLKKYVRS